MSYKNKKQLLLIVVVSLLVGGCAGVLGGVFLAPYLRTELSLRTFDPTGVTVNEDDSVVAVERVINSVVSITVSELVAEYPSLETVAPENTKPNSVPPPEPNVVKQAIAGGTGFIVSADGYILTNKHVVAGETSEYQVTLNDGSQYLAKIVDKDFNNDLAILKIEATDLPVATLGDSDTLKLGQTVLAIGYTLGEYENTVTRGIVSGINRQLVTGDYVSESEFIDGAIQTDTAVNPGNSGGPLINLRGEVVGVNTAINSDGQSIGFALPINVAKKVIESVMTSGHIVRPWLGVRYIVVDETVAAKYGLTVNYGALIVSGDSSTEVAVAPGSPADVAGLKGGDVILAINEVTLQSNTLTLELQKYNPDSEVVLKILHNGEEKDVTVRLVERPDEP